MHLNKQWLQDFIDVSDQSTESLREILERRGVEVESMLEPGSTIEGEVVVAKVLSCEPHPKADRLRVCEVDDGLEKVQVVCGAPNIAAGQTVAFARLGTVFRSAEGSLTIAERSLRGVQSRGMICSQQELGVSEQNDGIWVLPEKLEAGQSVFEALKLGPTFELGITPNRPDLFSYRGLGRELASALQRSFVDPVTDDAQQKSITPSSSPAVSVRIEAPEQCTRYSTLKLKGVTVRPSPFWLVSRLEAMGQRSINAVVDATNYVMFSLGQPMHAFDAKKLDMKAGITVRMAKEGEHLVTLDDQERKLEARMLVIASGEQAVALAGVMGGANSQVDDTTTEIVLESAHFEARCVRMTARALGMYSESSHRFERGTDPAMTTAALAQCAKLIQEICGGTIEGGVCDEVAIAHTPKVLTLSSADVEALLGIQVSGQVAQSHLNTLGFGCTLGKDQTSLQVTVPSFRPDIDGVADVIEEVARCIGFDAIEERLPAAALALKSGVKGPTQDHSNIDRVVRQCWLSLGCHEVVTYGFGDGESYGHWGAEQASVRIENPLGQTLATLRPSLLPNMLTVLKTNQRQGQSTLKFFEVGRVFESRDPDSVSEPKDRYRPTERRHCAVVLAGLREHGAWYGSSERFDFADIKGLVETFSESLGNRLMFRTPAKEDVPKVFHPYATAQLYNAEQSVGWVGLLHPRLSSDWELEGPICMAELNLDRMTPQLNMTMRVRAPSKFPAVVRDVAMLLPEQHSAESLTALLVEGAQLDAQVGILESVRLFDVYAGKGVPDGYRSLAFQLSFRSEHSTLQDDTIAAAMAQAVALAEQKLQAIPRGPT